MSIRRYSLYKCASGSLQASSTPVTLRAFHGDPAIKINAHIAADSLTHAAGCTLDDFKYDYHARYPAELGIPEWLAHVEDALFERISAEKSRTWPHDFLLAIAPGADLDRLRGPFIIMVLKGALETFDHVQFPEVKSVVDRVIALWQREDAGSPEYLGHRLISSDPDAD